MEKLLEIYNYIFSSSRNGFFNGFLFVVVGLLISNKEKEGFISQRRRNLVLAIVFAIAFAFVVEAFFINVKFHAVNSNTLLMLMTFTYFFVMWCLRVKVQTSKRTLWMRKTSTDIFLCQRIYLSALPELLPGSIFNALLSGNPYIGLLTVLLLTIITAAMLTALSGKSKWMSHFC